MIKLTHIQPQDEAQVACIVAEFLAQKYPYYFEIKCYADGVNHKPTTKFTARDYKKGENNG